MSVNDRQQLKTATITTTTTRTTFSKIIIRN